MIDPLSERVILGLDPRIYRTHQPLDLPRALRLNPCMCGRYSLTSSAAEIAAVFDVATAIEPFPPRYNIAPTQPILIVTGGREQWPDSRTHGRQALLVRWGLIPAWAKDPSSLPLLFNARSESAAERAAFRGAMRHRRCLVPASGFYEWRKAVDRGRSQPFFVRPRADGPIAFAGLMETYLAPDGSEIDTAAILTTAANATLEAIHQRMPVVIAPEAFERWLNCRAFGPGDVAGLMTPAPDNLFEAVPVSERVNAVANMSPDIQEPVEPNSDQTPEGGQSSFRF